MSDFGRRLKEIRESRDMTQAELATRAKITAVHVSHFETGIKPTPHVRTLIRIAEALNTSTDALLGVRSRGKGHKEMMRAWARQEQRMLALASAIEDGMCSDPAGRIRELVATHEIFLPAGQEVKRCGCESFETQGVVCAEHRAPQHVEGCGDCPWCRGEITDPPFACPFAKDERQ